MKYQNVCVESLGYTLPDEVISSEEIERRLEPLYARLKLPAGRLELMTGIKERRVWPVGTLPSQISVISGKRAIEVAGIYDVSNACLGLLNGMVQVANMIELGQIRAGLVVASEVSRPLMETTIAMLNDTCGNLVQLTQLANYSR